MTWLNPWAWLGAVTLAIPVLVHLLGRRRIRRQAFPTLRFLDVSRLVPARRNRLSDLALLAVRLGIVAAAVAALAQPLFVTAGRRRDAGRLLARAIVVDTSASLSRPTPPGTPVVDAARASARVLAAEATTATIVESAAVARALPGALAWVAMQSGRRELVVVSDFQTGAIDDRDLAAVPLDVGVRLVRIDTRPSSAPLEARASSGTVDVTSRLTLAPGRTDVQWTTAPHRGDAIARGPELLTGADERGAALAALAAASAVATTLTTLPDADRVVAIVYAHADARASILAAAGAIDRPWMADAVARLRSDEALVAAARRAARVIEPEPSLSSFVAAARDDDQRPVVLAARDTTPGRERLLLFVLTDAGSLTSAALIAAVSGATSSEVPASELDPSFVGDDAMARWQRPPGDVVLPTSRRDTGESDGRWLWIAAIALLGVETWMRRTRAGRDVNEVVHARVA